MYTAGAVCTIGSSGYCLQEYWLLVEGRRTGGGGEEESLATTVMADASETAKRTATVWSIGTRWQPLTRCPIERKTDQMKTIQVTLSGERREDFSFA